MKLATIAAVLSVTTLIGVGAASAAPWYGADESTRLENGPVLPPMAAQPGFQGPMYQQQFYPQRASGYVTPPTLPLGDTIPNFVGPTPEGGSPT